MLEIPNSYDPPQLKNGTLASHLSNTPSDLRRKNQNIDLNPQDDPHSTTESNTEPKTTQRQSPWTALINTILWTPPWCRWNPDNPPNFGLPLNFLFAFAGTFTVANLYYSHPILDELAHFFNVSQERASLIPTCSQAGYATGIIFLCPLGDIVRRRHFMVLLTFITATLWIGLCITTSFNVFLCLNFLTSVTTVTPQIMLPLVGDLVPPARRATALSIVSSGLVLGLLFARLLSGIIAAYSSWRNVYWLALGLQYLIVLLIWTFMPDYPPVNTDVSYFKILITIATYFVSSPVLIQATFMGFFLFATFTSFWTTLTFLLSGSPYYFSTVRISLYALAGLTPILLGPFYSRFVIDKYSQHFSILITLTTMASGICIGAYTGLFFVAGPALQAAFQDFGLQMTQIANRTAIFRVAPKARSRVNTAYMIGVFCGQLMGTAVGNRVYGESGWVLTGSVNLVFVGICYIILLLRGPSETGWIGWSGGFPIRRV